MNIAIDARILHYNTSGLSRYTRGLLAGLAAAEHEFSFTILQSAKQREAAVNAPGFTTQYLFTPCHFPAERHTLRFELRNFRCDLLQSMDFFTQAPASIPQICTLQDLHFAEHPESMSKASFTHYSKLNHFAVNAAMNICSSQATAADAQRIFGIAPSLLRVIYPGFTARTTPSQSAIDAASGKFELPPQFLLCVGTIEPRKNISRLLRAYHTALQELDNVLPPLVLAGRRGYQSDAILHEIEELQLTGRVKHLPEVSDTEIDCLYSRCSAVLYPSLYEGFGFPVLEAMAAGKPVLTSKISSLPEVAGDAAYFVDPLSIGSIAQGIAALTTDGDLRARLIELGKTRPSRFTWKNCAEQTLEVYRECLSSKTARSAHA